MIRDQRESILQNNDLFFRLGKTLEIGATRTVGHIPPQLGNLRALERLDLSYNKSNGESRGPNSNFYPSISAEIFQACVLPTRSGWDRIYGDYSRRIGETHVLETFT